jgi:hypothetical protein
MNRPHVELVPLWFRRRYAEANSDLNRPRIGESADERAAQAALRPKTGAVAPSVRNWLAAGATGGYRRGE